MLNWEPVGVFSKKGCNMTHFVKSEDEGIFTWSRNIQEAFILGGIIS